MDQIIETDVNAEFLAEARRRGYRPYINVMHASSNKTTPGLYMGSMQVAMRDDIGLRYYINIDMWDMSRLRDIPGQNFSARAEVQFHVGGEDDATVDVAINHRSFAQTESFYHDMWHKMSFGREDQG